MFFRKTSLDALLRSTVLEKQNVLIDGFFFFFFLIHFWAECPKHNFRPRFFCRSLILRIDKYFSGYLKETSEIITDTAGFLATHKIKLHMFICTVPPVLFAEHSPCRRHTLNQSFLYILLFLLFLVFVPNKAETATTASCSRFILKYMTVRSRVYFHC